MSFLSKFKGGAASSGQPANGSPSKKDPNAAQPTPLEKHLKDLSGPVRADGSDKFFGFENYGSTCYSNSIIQCLYYSAPFREHVMNFPPKEYIQQLPSPEHANGAPIPPRSTSAIPWPNPTSPARKQPPPPGSPAAQGKPEETKDSPEYRKRMALQAGPVLDMVHDFSNRYGMEESLFTALKDIFDAMLNNSSRIGVVSPHKFLEILRRENEMFRSAMHQDAHEFLNLLLNEVVENVEAFSRQHPTLNGSPKQHHANGAAPEVVRDQKAISTDKASTDTTNNGLDTRWVHDLFEGLLTSETRCLTCETLSQRDEPFLDLSVDLAAHTSVTACLRKFSAEEMLCERNKFHCDNCGGLQEAEKRMKIKRLPRVLALHLKRFKYTEDLQRLQKLFHRVVYPFHLRLFNTTDDAEDPDRLYELYAVVVHIGGGPYHGHYVSIIKTQDRGWLLFDDELVQPVDKSYVLNFFGGEPIPGLQDAKQLACAYVLFYQETTLEAMLREQEMEGQEPLPSRVSETADGTKDGIFSPVRNGFAALSPSHTIAEEHNGMENLAHAVTVPNLPSTTTPQPALLEPTQTTPAAAAAAAATTLPPPSSTSAANATAAIPPPVPKSRKERKSEAKEKKALAKAAEKELEEQRREASKKRIEAWKKQDEELKAAVEASKQTAEEEAAKRGGDEDSAAVVGNGVGKTGGGGFARLRPGSMSLRHKPKLFGLGAKEKDAGGGGTTTTAPAGAQHHLHTVPQEVVSEVGGDGHVDATPLRPSSPSTDAIKSPILSSTTEVRSPTIALPPPTAHPPPTTTTTAGLSEEKTAAENLVKKRARFSIGRKKSQTIL